MSHLKEEDFIDVLMGEPHDPSLAEHLANCEPCQQQFEQLSFGLDAAKMVEPKMPLMVRPTISHTQFDRRMKQSRRTWIAVAAMFFIGVFGLRIEVNENRMVFEFSLFSKSQNEVAVVDQQRLEELERQMVATIQAVEVKTAIAQQQIDARFNEVYADVSQEMDTLSHRVSLKMMDHEVKSAEMMNGMGHKVESRLKNFEVKGNMQ